jgi:3'-phosphoadenosine 5'-phosphosulfate sulfotransferase (PAPS reductase)/FAD synthetase
MKEMSIMTSAEQVLRKTLKNWHDIQCDVTAKIEEGIETISRVRAFTRHPIVRVFCLFSGGNDSICSTDLAMRNGLANEVIHIDTGIGIKQTHTHAEHIMCRYGWEHRTITPPDWTYRDIVLRRGFPGPAAHRYAYSWLKERAIAKLVRETKEHRDDKVILITGVRNRESSRRMGYKEPILRMGARIWTAPIFTWSKADCQQYMQYYNLPRNPVSDILGYSGECLCGAFAKPGEMAIIERHFPEAALKIHALELEAKAAGKPCVWGTRPPRNPKFDDQPFLPMCVGCLSDHTASTSTKY